MLSKTVADHVSPVNNKLNLNANPACSGAYDKEGDSISISSPIIDKIAIAFQIDDQTHRKTVLEDAKHLTADVKGDLFKSRGIIRGKIVGSSASLSLYAPNPQGSLEGPWRQRSPAHIKIGGMGTIIGRLEYNPAKWSLAQQRHLRQEVSRIFLLHPGPDYDIPTWACDENVTFTKVIGQGRVTKIHVALDLIGYAMDDVVWWNGRPDRTLFAKKEGLKSIYLGPFSDKKASKFCIYDKTAEMRSAAGTNKAELLAIPESWIRVEARLRNPNVMASELAQLTNPFLKLNCAIPDSAFQIANYPPAEGRGPHKLAMRYAGVPAFLSSIPNPLIRQKLASALTASRPLVYTPVTIWKKWPATLNTFPFCATIAKLDYVSMNE